MDLGRHLDLGALATGTTNYNGAHRDQEMPHGIGFFPHGDRNREKPSYGILMVEERGSDPHTR